MIAIDTNILVSIPWPCLAVFLAVVTSPRVFRTPTPAEVAVRALEVWLAAPHLSLLAEVEGAWPALRGQVLRGAAAVGRVHDARIAALCLFHGVSELWTAGRDFGRFPELKVVNPLITAWGGLRRLRRLNPPLRATAAAGVDLRRASG